MRPVAWWAVLSSATAPVLLIGGWTIAADRQPAFDPIGGTISALAAYGSTDRWIMTLALAGLGICHAVTALGLRPAASPGRIVLAVGGLATVLVAAFPLPAAGGSTAHGVAAGIAFAALGLWPALAVRREPTRAVPDAAHPEPPSPGPGTPRPEPPPADPGAPARPWALRPVVGIGAAVVLLALVGWFVATLDGGNLVGLSERVTAGAQALWPLAVVLSARRRHPAV